MKRFCAALLASLIALPAAAHDMWLQPARYSLPKPGVAMVASLVGHGPDRQRWSVAGDRVLRLQTIGPSKAVVDQRSRVGAVLDRNLALPLNSPGVHIVVLTSGHAESTLPAARFESYLREEGLTPAIALRRKTGKSGRPGREIYSRRAKALIQVGPSMATPQPHVVAPTGLSLEIVPERNPYRLQGARLLPVRVFYEGRPLAGALVRLTDLRADARPAETAISDAAGRAVFKARTTGLWQLNVVWTKPLAGHPKADFDTTFSSLTWGFD